MLKHWRYRLEKGRPHLILLVGLLLAIVGISVIGGLIVFLTNGEKGVGQSIWWTFLHVSDPGYLGDAQDPLTGFLGTLFTILGMVTFMAGLVGILTSLITTGLKRLHEGGAPVAFADHIVVVGWNSRVFTLVSDLLKADQHNQIALLGGLAKDAAELQLERRVFDPIEQAEGHRAARRARGSVVYRQGNAGIDHDLNRVSAGTASRFVLLAPHDGRSTRAMDVSQIRTLYSIRGIHFRSQRAEERFTTVVEFASEQFRSHAFYAVRTNPRIDTWVNYYEERLRKRGDRSFLPALDEKASINDMTAVNPNQIVSRVLVQCAVQPFMSVVYDELFSFVGREVFLWEPNSSWSSVWEQMLLLDPSDRPTFLGRHTADGLIIGSIHRGRFSFNPEHWSSLGDGTQYLMLGDKKSLSSKPLSKPRPAKDVACSVRLPEHVRTYRVLILGTNTRLPMVLEQLGDYSDQYPNCEVIVHIGDTQETPIVAATKAQFTIHQHQMDSTLWRDLGEFLEQSEHFDSIILMAEDLAIDDPEVDARVTLILVMLRAFRDDPHWRPQLESASIVAEVRDPRNKNILNQEKLEGDVIVGDGYVSGFLAQVCTDHRLEELYREILDFGNYEVYARELSLSDATATFASLVQSCARTDQVAIGILRYVEGEKPQPLLSPPFDQPLAEKDKAIVIAAR